VEGLDNQIWRVTIFSCNGGFQISDRHAPPANVLLL
jgi:hypothetical protein